MGGMHMKVGSTLKLGHYPLMFSASGHPTRVVLQAVSRVVVAAVSSSRQEVEASLGVVSGRRSSMHTTCWFTSGLLH